MVRRNLFEYLVADLNTRSFIIITGARQVGKTTLLKQFLNDLQEQKHSVYYVNLEDPDFLDSLNEHPKNIFSLFTIDKKQKNIFLIDEIQYLNNPTNFLKYLYDEYADFVKLYVTGSSAFYLDAKFKDSLAGRKKIYILNTLSLDEFLLFIRRKESGEISKIHSLRSFISG